MNSNNAPVKRDIQWFHNNNLVASYFLAEFLAETYPEWVEMRDELKEIFVRGQGNVRDKDEEENI